MGKRLGWLYRNWFHLWMRQRERQVAVHADHQGQRLLLAAEAASGGFAEPMLRKKAAPVNVE